jgi:hypothetical protein
MVFAVNLPVVGTREEEEEEALALLPKELQQLLRRYQGALKALLRRY